MNWKEDKQDLYSIFSYDSIAENWDNLVKDFGELIRIFQEKVEFFYKYGDWNRIIVEFWPDSGRIIAYPNKKGLNKSSWKVAFQINSNFVQNQYDLLPDPDENPEDFETQYLVLMHPFESSFSRTFDQEDILNILQNMYRKNEFRIFFQESDDEDSLHETFFIRPDK